MTPSGDIEAVAFNNAFFEQLGRAPGIVAACDEAAERIAQVARETAPVDKGDYKASIKTRHGKRAGRHASEVVSEDPAAILVESRFGTLARATLKAKRK